MDDRQFAVYEALLRVNKFGAEHSSAFQVPEAAVGNFNEASQLAGKIIVDDFEPGTAPSPATPAKKATIEDVYADLKAITDTARTIALLEPGFDVGYRLPEYTQREILAAAEDFLLKLADAATFAKFQAYSIDAAFLTELQADVTLISGKKSEQAGDRIGDIGGTAETAGQISEARKLIKALNTSVRNKFRNDPVVLAKWSAASRIHRTSSRNPGNPPPTPPAP